MILSPAVLTVWVVTAETNADLREQVRRAEIAFAKTMADRDHAAFVSFLSDETVFMGRTILRGKSAVAEAWKRFYEGPQAPFSWEPDRVEVLDSGTLGMTSGPVRDPSGKRTGTFNSVWRREDDGKWKIIFDIGCPPCEPATPVGPADAAMTRLGLRTAPKDSAGRPTWSGPSCLKYYLMLNWLSEP